MWVGLTPWQSNFDRFVVESCFFMVWELFGLDFERVKPVFKNALKAYNQVHGPLVASLNRHPWTIQTKHT